MCADNKRTYGVELEGYTSSCIIGDRMADWSFVEDGSLDEGESECYSCDGNGSHTETCDDCCGDGNEQCEDCSDGTQTCPTCDGSKELDCDECDGDSDCEWCDSGKTECGECNSHGEVDCSSCDGNSTQDCSSCGGRGNVESECYSCDGSGCGGDGGRGGVECVSGILTEGDYSPIDDVFDYINGYDFEVDNTCGTHVHIGANDYTAQDLSKATILMNIIEPVIFGSVGTNRIDGNFCKKMRSSLAEYLIDKGDTITKQQIAEAYYGHGVDTNNLHKYDMARYYGLNLHSYFYRGTLEFRYFEPMVNSDETKELVDFCIKIVDFAKYVTFEQLKVVGEDFYDTVDYNSLAGKVKSLLGLDLEYNIRLISEYGYNNARNNVARQFRSPMRVSEAV